MRLSLQSILLSSSGIATTGTGFSFCFSFFYTAKKYDSKRDMKFPLARENFIRG